MGRSGRDRIVVLTTYAASAYHHQRCKFESLQVRCTRCNIM